MEASVIDPFPSVSAALADARQLDDQDLCDAIRDAEMALRAQQAQFAVLAAELNSRIQAMGCPLNGAAEELATMLAISRAAPTTGWTPPSGLCDRELLWAALYDGRIDQAKAVMIHDLLAAIPDPRREELELIAIGYAHPHRPPTAQRNCWPLTCQDPTTPCAANVDRRGVWITPAGHGMADISAHLSAEHAEIFMEALAKLAAADDCADPYQQGDARTATQRQADALVGSWTYHPRGRHRGRGDQRRCLIGDNDWTPSKRLGPIGSQIARDLCTSPDARWRRLVTTRSPANWPPWETIKYRIPDHIRQAVKARDLTCRFPGCHARAEYFDCDHIIAHPASQPARTTSPDCADATTTKPSPPGKPAATPHPTHDLIWTSPWARPTAPPPTATNKTNNPLVGGLLPEGQRQHNCGAPGDRGPPAGILG